MPINDDFTDMLAEEVLTDMAGSFFGSRVKVDEMIELFDQLVQTLKQKQEKIESIAGLITFLFFNKDIAKRFYRLIDVSPELLLEEPSCDPELLPEKQLSALTGKGKYTKYLFWGYETLEDAITNYLEGSPKPYPDERDKTEPTYKKIKHMSKIINEQIRKVNERSAIGALRYTREFNPESLEKERITGGSFADIDSSNKLDRNMRFEPIDFDSLNLKKYPKLPEFKSIKSNITSFGKKIYSENTGKAKEVISEIENEINKKSSNGLLIDG